MNAFHDACDSDDVSRVETLLAAPDVDVDEVNDRGMTALHWLLTADIARLLIRAGAALAVRDTASNWSLLHFAGAHRNYDAVAALVVTGAPLDDIDTEGRDPSDVAMRYAPRRARTEPRRRRMWWYRQWRRCDDADPDQGHAKSVAPSL